MKKKCISFILLAFIITTSVLVLPGSKINAADDINITSEGSGSIKVIQDTSAKPDALNNALLDKLKEEQNVYGCINILGDSISEGYAVDYEDEYVTLLFKKIFELLGVEDTETDINMPDVGTEYFKYGGDYSYGFSGPIRKSLILKPNATITFTGDFKYVDVWYKRTPDSGSIEIYKNNVLQKTLDLSGEEGIVTTYPSQTIERGEGVYTIKCVGAPVEILGVIRLNSEPGSTIYCNRMALSATATSDYIYEPILESIYTIGSLNNSKKNLFIIALGTNDMFNKQKASPVAMYVENMRTIAKYLMDRGQDVILYWPPTADPEIYEPRYGFYGTYKEALYGLAEELNVPVIDVSVSNPTSGESYYDGLHPNAYGHKLYYQDFLDVILKQVPQLKYAKIRRLIM